MRPQNKTSFIIFEEKFYAVGAELDYVASAIGITDEVRLDT